MRFVDRAEAGRLLGERLRWLHGQQVVVLGLPRGGVPVAAEVARVLRAPLDVIVVRKLGVPGQPELAMGAVGEDDVRVLNDSVIRQSGATPQDLASAETRERAEVERRAQLLRGHGHRQSLVGRTAVIVDDGVATGATARAACQVARAHGAKRVLLAVPVAPPDWAHGLAGAADEFVSLMTPEQFQSVGQWYENFGATTDAEVSEVLNRAEESAERLRLADPGAGAAPDPRDHEEVLIQAGQVQLAGIVTVPVTPVGAVIFAHGSGSSRHSARNAYVADQLNQAGLATLLFDLLLETEECCRTNVFDVELLAERLTDVTTWTRELLGFEDLPVGYFGASTGAAAALWAAAELEKEVAAVVSRGGRPDLATDRLDHVCAPTLLIVGGDDRAVLELNRQARSHLRCESELTVIPHATHLFEEPGTLEQVAKVAADWFLKHFSSGGWSAE